MCPLPPTLLVEKPLKWSNAQHYCREKGFNLATVDSMGAMKALQPLIGKQSYVWLGLHGGNPMRWYWSLADEDFYKEGKRDYRNFSLGADSYSLVTSKDGQWSSTNDSSSSFFFICYDCKESAVTDKLMKYLRNSRDYWPHTFKKNEMIVCTRSDHCMFQDAIKFKWVTHVPNNVSFFQLTKKVETELS